MIFEAPNGLYYDTALHDFIEPSGALASAERVAATWGMPVEQVEQGREERAAWAAQRQASVIAQDEQSRNEQASHDHD